VSILWFPTGGGKTEAYLGLIATALIFDRLRGKPRGVNTWMRFPLRMLSLQQMERLSKVISELNELRDEIAEIAMGDPFSIGFFVGQLYFFMNHNVFSSAYSSRSTLFFVSEHNTRTHLKKICFITTRLAASLFRATLSIFGLRRQLSAALIIISCLRALGPSSYDLAERS
jgi:hypothetical protein